MCCARWKATLGGNQKITLLLSTECALRRLLNRRRQHRKAIGSDGNGDGDGKAVNSCSPRKWHSLLANWASAFNLEGVRLTPLCLYTNNRAASQLTIDYYYFHFDAHQSAFLLPVILHSLCAFTRTESSPTIQWHASSIHITSFTRVQLSKLCNFTLLIEKIAVH